MCRMCAVPRGQWVFAAVQSTAVGGPAPWHSLPSGMRQGPQEGKVRAAPWSSCGGSESCGPADSQAVAPSPSHGRERPMWPADGSTGFQGTAFDTAKWGPRQTQGSFDGKEGRKKQLHLIPAYRAQVPQGPVVRPWVAPRSPGQASGGSGVRGGSAQAPETNG